METTGAAPDRFIATKAERQVADLLPIEVAPADHHHDRDGRPPRARDPRHAQCAIRVIDGVDEQGESR